VCDVTHEFGNLAASKQDEDDGEDDQPMPGAKASHSNYSLRYGELMLSASAVIDLAQMQPCL
jgi:hypothetical protein